MIAVIDSGVGGISTLSVIRSILPNEDYVYLADSSNSPYGDKSDDFIINRIIDLVSDLDKSNLKAVVIACNTATNASIDFLRSRQENIVYVGVEPSIKPAYNELTWGKALVLLTPSTAKSQKFNFLLSNFDKNRLIIYPLKELAFSIEQNINNLSKIKPIINEIFYDLKGEPIESVVLGCTHYCLVKNYIYEAFKAKIYDSNSGTAFRLYSLLAKTSSISRKGGSIKFIKI